MITEVNNINDAGPKSLAGKFRLITHTFCTLWRWRHFPLALETILNIW